MTHTPSLPFVSIIIPMYNAASTLGKCLDSLTHLDYPMKRLEILCVDGRSTDTSREIAAADPVRLLDNPQRGVVSGRNRGWEAARGELISTGSIRRIAFSDASWIRNAVPYFTDATVAGVTGPIELPSVMSKSPFCRNGDRTERKHGWESSEAPKSLRLRLLLSERRLRLTLVSPRHNLTIIRLKQCKKKTA